MAKKGEIKIKIIESLLRNIFLYDIIILIKYKILKRSTSDEENPRYNVGGFKIVPNMIDLVNVINTTAPEDVKKEIEELITEYNSKTNITLEDLIDFHYIFELIHPFCDENDTLVKNVTYPQNAYKLRFSN